MTGTAALLSARLIVARGEFRLDLPLSVAAGEVVALLGPNGAGKSTAVRALAGLTPLTGGRIHLGQQRLDDPAARVWVPPERRKVGVVFQDYLLFPHLSALDNVAFGPRSAGVPRRAARATAAHWLEQVGLSDHAHRKPRTLSGGQAQRVALARALAVDPVLLLLDEPLAALDAHTRLDIRDQLHRRLQAHRGSAVLVTHDPLDALVLADRLVIIEDGQIVQEGDAAGITAQPRTEYVARLVGLNLYRGRAAGHTVTLPTAGPADGEFRLHTATAVDGEVFVAFAPTAVVLHPHPPGGSPNTWPATISGVQHHGDNLRIALDGPITTTADLTPAEAATLQLSPGAPVWVTLPPAHTRSYPASTRPSAP